MPAVDVAIVGGGPAGAAAALTLLRHSGLRVALVERSRYDRWRVGETLPPGARPLLEYLGHWQRFAAEDHRHAHATAAAWGDDVVASTPFMFSPHGHGWHLDRRRFDAGLAEHVAALGGLVLTGARPTAEKRDARGGWRLDIRHGARSLELRARHLIDATGRAAAVARRRGARRVRDDRLVGVVGVLGAAGPVECDGSTVVETVLDGWWYSVLLPDGRLLAAHMSDGDLVRASGSRGAHEWLAAAARAGLLRERAAGTTLTAEPVVRPAWSQRLEPVAGDGWVAAGEAAVAFDPLAALGISHALASGIAAARAAHAALTGAGGAAAERYAADVAGHYHRYRVRQAATYALERRWPDAPFWRRRACTASVVHPSAYASGHGHQQPASESESSHHGRA